MLSLCEEEIFDWPVCRRDRAEANEIEWFQQQTRARLQRDAGSSAFLRSLGAAGVRAVRNDIQVARELEERPSLRQLPLFVDDLQVRLEEARFHAISRGDRSGLREIAFSVAASPVECGALIETLRSIAMEAGNLADAMDFSFLLNTRRKLMSVGFNVDKQNSSQRAMTCSQPSRERQCSSRSRKRTCCRKHGSVWGGPIPREWQSRLAVVDGHDVRIPDADVVDALVSQHAAGSQPRRRGRLPGVLRKSQRCALGDFGIRHITNWTKQGTTPTTRLAFPISR